VAGQDQVVSPTFIERLQESLRCSGQPLLLAEEEARFATYLSLLLKWNARMNLTAIRAEGEILQRHFLESIYCARMLPVGSSTVLDYGSGAGFPGLPCAICRDDCQVTLAESQGKKVAFLREAVRQLGVSAVVHHGRVEEMDRRRMFSAVLLRAVDRMKEAAEGAVARVEEKGWLVLLTSRDAVENWRLLAGVVFEEPLAIPMTDQRVLLMGQRLLS